jgi:hypothetical protein
MTQHKEMHAFVICDGYGRINLFLQTRMLIDFESISNSISSFIADKALFKYKRCISFHILNSSIFLSLFVNNDIEFFNWLLVLAVQLNMHFDHLSGLSGDHVVELSGEVLGRETEILGQNHVAENVLTIRPLYRILILTRQVLVNSSRLEVEQLVHIVMKLK